ncbi:putative zinc-type alcohol dehydrogenase-like protein [Mucilaginibacter gracilis]|uniref:Putative zinc-type alcohol dehydrogenase-like protein n=1 Tax=Mucilaginibacter gracilis TaxID=423350 RepID=A0A495J1P5_9SPHI|nr:NAD(P)-dependent alcohol dehydrogenase [Mucilaginibacter gracilis]RKR82890.1 putative zinc-type alcohol dehydrogenase-like protein [Mucilaginibacter gracilis]
MKKLLSLAMLLAMTLFSAVYAQTGRIPAKGLAVLSGDGQFKPYSFSRHAVGDNDIQIEILYASICHSDVHHVRQDWTKETFPMVPGHEIAGRVVKVGKSVTKFKVGDYAGVGCLVNSCGHCEYCKAGLEQYCKQAVFTYHSKDQFHDHETTQGGYSNNITLTENFAIKIPANADLKRVAPLLCAGITTYSPIHYVGIKKGVKVGVAGFGGLGHMAVQYAVKLGAEVTVFDITEDKRADALRLGAARYVNVTDTTQLKGLDDSLNFILSTIPAAYDPGMYLKMLKIDGQLAIVGLPPTAKMPVIPIDKLVWQGNRKVFGSQIGGIKETQEMLDYSVANHIYPEVEIIKADGPTVTNAYQNVLDGKVKFRYVIDMKTLK